MHRPDHHECAEDLKQSLSTEDKVKLPSAACMWPYINLEDLLKSKSLLIFLNARGRNVPLTFALTEGVFSPLARMSVCGPEPELEKYLLCLSQDPLPGLYGQTEAIEGELKDIYHDERGWKYCMRPTLQTLYIQHKLMRFLVLCCEAILHDMSDEALMAAYVMEEPPHTELELADDIGHTTFADALAVAPYRNRGSIDFSRLRGYISSLLNNAKDHIWALREDPSYLSEKILDLADHRVELLLNSKGQMNPWVDTPEFMQAITRELICEAYTMLCMWYELHKILEQIEKLPGDVNSSRFASLMAEFNCRSRLVAGTLSHMVRAYSHSAPKMRKFSLRKNSSKTLMHIGFDYSAVKTVIELDVVTIFSLHGPKQKQPLEDDQIYFLLDILDVLARKHPSVKDLFSPRLSDIVTQMSLVGECIMQHSIWYDTPSALGLDTDAKHSHDHCFADWIENLDNFHLPVHLVNPARGKLRYPSHKVRSKSSVEAMRTAEENVDQFWERVDKFFDQKTGVDQYAVIKQCLSQGGQMRRTPPWEPSDPDLPHVLESQEYVYQPFSRISHDEIMQVTGTFDKLAAERKTKIKTRGLGTLSQKSIDEFTDTTHHQTEQMARPRVVCLDKRAYKAIKAMFHVRSSNPEDVPRAVKWDEFKRAMVRIGFSAEKLQGSAWQFTPGTDLALGRSIQFHEPHSDSEIPYIMARRFGRRLERVYGWTGSMFRLA